MPNITITDNGDGTYAVQGSGGTDPTGQESPPQTANSPEEVCQLVEQMLGGDQEGQDPQQAWDQEAAQRPEMQPQPQGMMQ